jgi:hypothetical protein
MTEETRLSFQFVREIRIQTTTELQKDRRNRSRLNRLVIFTAVNEVRFRSIARTLAGSTLSILRTLRNWTF